MVRSRKIDLKKEITYWIILPWCIFYGVAENPLMTDILPSKTALIICIKEVD